MRLLICKKSKSAGCTL